MSVECSECEWDARAGHDPSCSRSPDTRLAQLCKAVVAIADVPDEDSRLAQLALLADSLRDL